MIALLVCRNLQRNSTLHLHGSNFLFRRLAQRRQYDPLRSPLQEPHSTQTLPQRTQESSGSQLHLQAMLQVLRSLKPFVSVSKTLATKSFPLLYGNSISMPTGGGTRSTSYVATRRYVWRWTRSRWQCSRTWIGRAGTLGSC